MFLGVISPRSFGSSTCCLPPAVAQRDGHSPLGIVLANDVAVEFGARSPEESMLDIVESGWGRGLQPRYFREVFRWCGACWCRCTTHPRSPATCFTMSRAPGARCCRQQRLGRCLRVGAARPDGDDAVLRFQHIAVAGDNERGFPVGHRQHGLQPAQHAVGAPVLGQLDGGERTSWPWCLSSLASKRSNRVKASAVAPAKPGQYLVVVELAHLACGAFHDDVAERDLGRRRQSPPRSQLPSGLRRRTLRMVVP